jgi:hypothetical protein
MKLKTIIIIAVLGLIFAGVVCAAVDKSESLVLDERDQAALREIDARLNPLRLSLADVAVQRATLEAKGNELVQAIGAQQQEAQRVITGAAKALGLGEKARFRLDYESMSLILLE